MRVPPVQQPFEDQVEHVGGVGGVPDPEVLDVETHASPFELVEEEVVHELGEETDAAVVEDVLVFGFFDYVGDVYGEEESDLLPHALPYHLVL